MSLRKIAYAAGSALAIWMLSSGASAATVVLGTADIFLAGSTTAPPPGDFNGTLPLFSVVMAGQTVDITASGTVGCCGAGGITAGPDGFAGNPLDGSGHSIITNSTGSAVSNFSDPTGSFPLVGTFFDSLTNSPIGNVFIVGSSLNNLLVPTGADRLYFGLPDASGFNGPSGFYNDNTGSFSVVVNPLVSAVPEPSTWAMMLLGFGALGFALRRSSKRSEGGLGENAFAAA